MTNYHDILNLLDEKKDIIGDGLYLELCNALKKQKTEVDDYTFLHVIVVTIKLKEDEDDIDDKLQMRARKMWIRVKIAVMQKMRNLIDEVGFIHSDHFKIDGIRELSGCWDDTYKTIITQILN